jgi:hypothetical protein
MDAPNCRGHRLGRCAGGHHRSRSRSTPTDRCPSDNVILAGISFGPTAWAPHALAAEQTPKYDGSMPPGQRGLSPGGGSGGPESGAELVSRGSAMQRHRAFAVEMSGKLSAGRGPSND